MLGTLAQGAQCFDSPCLDADVVMPHGQCRNKLHVDRRISSGKCEEKPPAMRLAQGRHAQRPRAARSEYPRAACYSERVARRTWTEAYSRMETADQ